jgi:hypothetical protein
MPNIRALAWIFLLAVAACSESGDDSPLPESADDVATISGIREESLVPPPPEPSRAAVPAAEDERTRLQVTPREEVSERTTTSQLVFFIRTPEGQAACPAEILVTDPEGRRTGVDPATRELLREIPDASYDEAGISLPARSPCGEADEEELEVTPKLVIQSAPAGDYRVMVVGTAAGAYTLIIDQYPADWRQRSRRMQPGQGTIEIGQTETYEIRVEMAGS